MRRQGGRYIRGIEGQELGTEFGEVDFLGVGAAVGFCVGPGDLARWDAGTGAATGVRDPSDLGEYVPSRSTMVRVRF